MNGYEAPKLAVSSLVICWLADRVHSIYSRYERAICMNHEFKWNDWLADGAALLFNFVGHNN